MNKQRSFHNVNEINELRKILLNQMYDTMENIRSLVKDNSSINSLKKLKFEKVVRDSIFQHELNFIEYLNQTFTYLVCLYAGSKILHLYPDKEIIINFGTNKGFDVYTSDESINCECFATTSVHNNQKLRNDLKRLEEKSNSKYKFVFFYCDNNNQATYIEKIKEEYRDIKIYSITFDELIGNDNNLFTQIQ